MVLSAKYQSAVSAFTCTWSAYCVVQLVQPVGRDRCRRRTPRRPGRSRPAVTSSEIWQAVLLDDLVGVPVGLRVGVPHLEVRVADEHRFLVRVVRLPHVRPGARRHVVAGQLRGTCCPGTTYANGSASLSRNSGSGSRQVDRQRVGAVVGDDALREVAVLRRALVRADDAGVERRRARDVNWRSNVVTKSLGFMRRAVGELDALADVEGVGLAAVGRLRDRGRQVRDELRARRAADALELHEPVVGVDQELPTPAACSSGPGRRRRSGVREDGEGAALLRCPRGRRAAPPDDDDELEPLPPHPAATAITAIGIESLNTLLISSRMPPPREKSSRTTTESMTPGGARWLGSGDGGVDARGQPGEPLGRARWRRQHRQRHPASARPRRARRRAAPCRANPVCTRQPGPARTGGGRSRRCGGTGPGRAAPAGTPARGICSARPSSAISAAMSPADVVLSSPRSAASTSIILRRSTVRIRPRRAARSFTRVMPTISISALVAALSETASIRMSRSASVSAVARSRLSRRPPPPGAGVSAGQEPAAGVELVLLDRAPERRRDQHLDGARGGHGRVGVSLDPVAAPQVDGGVGDQSSGS